MNVSKQMMNLRLSCGSKYNKRHILIVTKVELRCSRRWGRSGGQHVDFVDMKNDSLRCSDEVFQHTESVLEWHSPVIYRTDNETCLFALLFVCC